MVLWYKSHSASSFHKIWFFSRPILCHFVERASDWRMTLLNSDTMAYLFLSPWTLGLFPAAPISTDLYRSPCEPALWVLRSMFPRVEWLGFWVSACLVSGSNAGLLLGMMVPGLFLIRQIPIEVCEDWALGSPISQAGCTAGADSSTVRTSRGKLGRDHPMPGEDQGPQSGVELCVRAERRHSGYDPERSVFWS